MKITSDSNKICIQVQLQGRLCDIYEIPKRCQCYVPLFIVKTVETDCVIFV